MVKWSPATGLILAGLATAHGGRRLEHAGYGMPTVIADGSCGGGLPVGKEP